jgi:hypothetical protein
MLTTQNLPKLCLFTALAESSSNILNVDGRFMQFHGDHSKTNPIHGSWSNIYRKWRKFQGILLMMAENSPDFTANTEKLTRFTKVRLIFTVMAENSSDFHRDGREFQPVFTVMAENLCNIYGDGRTPNPKSMEIEAKFTTMAENLNDIYSDGGTLYVNFSDSAIQTRDEYLISNQ